MYLIFVGVQISLVQRIDNCLLFPLTRCLPKSSTSPGLQTLVKMATSEGTEVAQSMENSHDQNDGYDNKCIFCKIINKEVKSDLLYCVSMKSQTPVFVLALTMTVIRCSSYRRSVGTRSEENFQNLMKYYLCRCSCEGVGCRMQNRCCAPNGSHSPSSF